MPARCTAAALLALSASLQPPVPRRTHLKRHASTDDAALLDAYRAEIAPDAADDWWREFVAATERPPRPAVRCVDAAAAAALRASTECEEIPWAPGRGYWLNEEPSKRVAHVAGDYYVQEAAAMVAVAALLRGEDLRRRVVAVDACAAPGGKTVQLATALRDAGADAVVVANEPSSSRLGALVANAVRCGVGPCVESTSVSGGGRRGDSGRTRRKFDFYTGGPVAAVHADDRPETLRGAASGMRRFHTARRAVLGRHARAAGRAGPREAPAGPTRRRLDEGDRRDLCGNQPVS